MAGSSLERILTRLSVASAMLRRDSWSLKLIQAMEAGKVARVDLSLTQRQTLLDSKSATIASKASSVFSGETTTPRSEVVKQYAIAAHVGDVAKGREVF